MTPRCVRTLGVVLLIGLRVLPAAAQGQDRSAVLFDNRDIFLLSAATAGSALVSHWDKQLARAFTDSARHARHPLFKTGANRASLATETVLMLTGGTVYEVAKLRHDEGVEDVAFHTTASIFSAAMFIQVIRGTLGRARPYVVDDSGEVRDADPYEFSMLHGFTSFNYRSWPSMHAMASFAAASALSTEMKWRDTRDRKAISAGLYTAACLPSLARMYLDEHWASDIAMGVFIGVFSGQKVVNYTHAHPDNRPDNFFLGRGVRAQVTLGGSEPVFTVLPTFGP